MIEQENFWAGSFGDEYTDRHRLNLVPANIHFFSRIFKSMDKIKTILELGAGSGLNLLAIQQLLPDAKFSAIEVNKKAIELLMLNCPWAISIPTSIFNFYFTKKRELVFTKGFLIHIAPLDLPKAYKIIYKASNKYILLCEYYNPTPVEVEYRGHKNKLFKRDFAGEMMDMYKDLKLIDYGFVYHRDIYPQDDVTWFLMEKYDRRKI